jgi:hypothetical protein
MKQDIAEAEESIRVATESDFRPVMDAYQEKLADFKIKSKLYRQ